MDMRHVYYEVQYLRYTTSLLVNAPMDPSLRNVIIEAFVLHFRNLYQFLAFESKIFPKSPCNDCKLPNYAYANPVRRSSFPGPSWDVNCNTFGVDANKELPDAFVEMKDGTKRKLSEFYTQANQQVCHVTTNHWETPANKLWPWRALRDVILTNFQSFLNNTGKSSDGALRPQRPNVFYTLKWPDTPTECNWTAEMKTDTL